MTYTVKPVWQCRNCGHEVSDCWIGCEKWNAQQLYCFVSAAMHKPGNLLEVSGHTIERERLHLCENDVLGVIELKRLEVKKDGNNISRYRD
jgi:hypothetical protein